MIIKSLHLKSRNLEQQKELYTKILGFNLIESYDNSFSVEIGYSKLTFTQSNTFTPYHFAFNIPSNQEIEAQFYLREKFDLIKDVEQELIYFDFWDAYALYFFDADDNIVEYISRKTLDKNSLEEFGTHSVIGISEIGLALDDIGPVYRELNEHCMLEIYSGIVDRFLTVGDEFGLFIMVNMKKKKNWYPSEIPTQKADFQIEFLNKGALHTLQFIDGKLQKAI